MSGIIGKKIKFRYNDTFQKGKVIDKILEISGLENGAVTAYLVEKKTKVFTVKPCKILNIYE